MDGSPNGSTISAAAPATAGSIAATFHRVAPSVGTTVLPFALVLYLALKGGGYDSVVRSEVAIAIWWTLLLGAIIGILPTRSRPPGPTAWIGLGAVALLAAWVAASMIWSDSPERSATEAARLLSYLGVFAIAVVAQGRDGLRQTLSSVAAAIGLVGVLALLSRIEPSWFPANETASYLPGSENRLSYPLNYWNGVATLMAMGVPLLLAIASQARLTISRATATAAIPILSLVVYFTISRGGFIELGIGALLFSILSPRRLEGLPYLLVAAAGSALLIASAAQRDLVRDAKLGAAAEAQAHDLMIIAIVVVAGAGLLAAAVHTAARTGRFRVPTISRRKVALGFVAAVMAFAIIFLAAGSESRVDTAWSDFKSESVVGSDFTRLESVSGNGRYQLWQSAIDSIDLSNASALTGTGAGTFEFANLQLRDSSGFARDAHSLYIETLGELGVIGLFLLCGALFFPVAVGVARLITRANGRDAFLAGGVAGMGVFLAAALVDWVWELSVIPIAFLLIAGATIAIRRAPDRDESNPDSSALAGRMIFGAVAVVALISIGLPLGATNATRASQAEAQGRSADLAQSLSDARSAADLQPYAATPYLQQALVLELLGDYGAATKAAREATRNEPTNWRNWFILARIQAEAGDNTASVDSFREARRLNPQFPLFNLTREAAE